LQQLIMASNSKVRFSTALLHNFPKSAYELTKSLAWFEVCEGFDES
jgi:hypothetical protein